MKLWSKVNTFVANWLSLKYRVQLGLKDVLKIESSLDAPATQKINNNIQIIVIGNCPTFLFRYRRYFTDMEDTRKE